MTPAVRPLIAGNWKMNGTRACLTEIKAMAEGLKGAISDKIDALICPPATLLYVATALCDDSPLMVGAQDCHQYASGPHTGDISAEMIADCFGTHVIVGHSERRMDHAETDHLVRAKAEAALACDLTVILCVGETASEREDGQALEILARQLAGSLPAACDAEQMIIAYEPVWAIGTGVTPTADDIAAAHAFIRRTLSDRYGPDGAAMRLLYGGSVKPANAGALLSIENVDGALVGGASLKADDFLAICRACETCAA